MTTIILEARISVPDEITEGAVDCVFDEFLEHTLPDYLEVDEYRIEGRRVYEQ